MSKSKGQIGGVIWIFMFCSKGVGEEGPTWSWSVKSTAHSPAVTAKKRTLLTVQNKGKKIEREDVIDQLAFHFGD